MSNTADRPLFGMALVVMAVFSFALGDVLTKYLAARLPVPEIMAVRYLVGLVLLSAVMGPRMGRGLWQTRRTGPVIVRALTLAAGSLTIGLALRVMPVAETISIIYLAPFLVLLLSGPVLGETVRRSSWIGAVIAFAGVLMIVRPGSGLDTMGVIYAATNLVFGTVYHLLSRSLARSETTTAMLFHVSWVGAASFALMMPFTPGMRMPDPIEAAALVGLGAFATGGHFLLTAAYRFATASMLAPVNYVHLVWAGILGFVVFGHLPDPVSLTGIALVLVAGVGLAVAGHRAARAARLTGSL